MIEPISATAIAVYLAKKIKDNKAVKDLFNDFTEAAANEFRAIFLREDNTPKEALKDLIDAPDNKLNQDGVANTLEKALQKMPNAEVFLQDVAEKINGTGTTTPIINGKNVVAAPMQAGGSIIVGDNNQIGK